MNTATNTLKVIDGIYGISPITKPPLSFIESSLLSSLVILLICIATYLIWKLVFSTKAISKRKILSLQSKYNNNKINTHDTIYLLCFILRNGLEIKKISKHTELPKKASLHKKKWDVFSEEMSTLRYKNDTELDIAHVFEESIFWLRNWS